ncbi:dTDP-4-dehydrorhamnose 3,5-epimerase [Croceifilum oryzae]|uniref:dTDP-4-dehydrorhamnose 3,5-epimerase n=1 Tax=Croceifilum oryzae TaxID=1553429 RepID=A0AAJ1TJ41_9BACL|nr:dTDP-4-dehydrorhamnose 3,5-epimerase [Croceifilum oryzae]MDQ0417051.1 dTDP-4-dehydrorhamnose 3,5-epimerase [Croceifilum oryzae]
MIFKELELEGAYVIELEPIIDHRGLFARTWCEKEFSAQGLTSNWVQCNISVNKKKGTIRGMHYQAPPYEEVKLVHCVKGAIYDVIVDLRPESATFKKWTSVMLGGENRNSLYIPEGFAHGFQTLEDDTEVFYQMGQYFHPESVRGVRFNDPAFQIQWPDPEHTAISEKDLAYEDFGL